MDIARASIRRRVVVLFLCVIMAIAGVAGYFQIGKLEDPAYTIKTAFISIAYPGSTAYECEQEVVSRLEEAVQSMGEVKRIRSRALAGSAVMYVDIKDSFTSKDLPQIWDVLRQKITDASATLPAGASVYINNDFGQVFGQYYALVGDGCSMRDLWDYAYFLKKQLALVPNVARVDIFGEQAEGIYVELSTTRMSALELSPSSIISVLNDQNTLTSIGTAELGNRYVRIMPTGAIMSPEDIGDLVIGGSGGHIIRLKEVASVRRDYIDPQSSMMRFNGQPSLALGIATVEGGNVVTMGQAVDARLRELEAQRPIGMELKPIYMQSDQVVTAIQDFIVNLAESLSIVVGVLLVFMGMRSGLIIGAVLLITVAGTFAIMNFCGIFLQTVSLAALIIALGSLVDNAIVVTEGMLVGVQRGSKIDDAASESVSSSQWAMLGGTLIAVAAFAPIGLSQDSTGEYCRSLLQVVGISMMLSWVMALTVTPVFGKLFLKPSKQEGDPYDRFLFRAYRAFLEGCLRNRILTLAVTGALFVGSLMLFGSLTTSFFPDMATTYFMTDLFSTEGTGINAHAQTTAELAKFLRSQPETKNVSEFIGRGGLRFMLTYGPPDPNTAYSQLMVEAKRAEDTDTLLKKTQRFINTQMPQATGVCKRLARGSGSTPKIEVRFYGEDKDVLRSLAKQAAAILEDDPKSVFVRTDWREPVEVLRPRLMKDQMQNLGVTRAQVNQTMLMATTGATVGAFRDGDRSLAIKVAFDRAERNKADNLSSLPLWAPAASRSVPMGTVMLSQDVGFEDNIIMRRNRTRVITAASDIADGENASAMVARVQKAIESIPLPVGYRMEWGGERESSSDAMAGIKVAFLPSLIFMFAVMVFLFNGFRQPLIIFGAIPLIIIGVAGGLWLAGMTVSFMAFIGLLSLIGMLAKNSIVLLDQVSADFEAGRDKYEAIVEDAVSRVRPVAMSALTTVLGMIPLVPDLLFGPMAVVIMAGLTVSTILTLIVIPVATAMVYRVPAPER